MVTRLKIIAACCAEIASMEFSLSITNSALWLEKEKEAEERMNMET